MSALPTVVTHLYDPARGPFHNLCGLSDREATAILDSIRASGIRAIRPNYLSRRRAVEDWLIRESRTKIDGARLARPIYFFLGDFADGLDASRPEAIVLPLAIFPRNAITFTYPDSMASLPLALRPDNAPTRQPYHGQVFTLDEIAQVVARYGMPVRRWPRESTAVSDGFIEVQVWDDAPIKAAMDDAASTRRQAERR